MSPARRWPSRTGASASSPATDVLLPVSKYTGSSSVRIPERIWTIGHSTLPAEDFIALLGTHGIELLADVRRFPSSRRHPQFNREPLTASLEAARIEYLHF